MNTDQENELKMIGTCGHRISDGITSWVKEGGQLVYGTFCGNCVYFFHKQGRLVNKEISDLMLNSEYSLKAELEKARELIGEILGIENKNKPVVEALKDVRHWEDKAKEFLKTKEGE